MKRPPLFTIPFTGLGFFPPPTIHTSTARRYLQKVGDYEYSHVGKDVYYDGHEREDVVEYRKKFLKQMAEYARLMPMASCDDTNVRSWHIEIFI
jgi:hypothetical protein